MDPNQTLSELQYLVKEVAQCDSRICDDLKERFTALDEWLSRGGFNPWPASKEPNRFADQRARMSDAQRNRLWQMCADYNVPFNEADYFLDSKDGMVEGWVGGFYHGNGNSSLNDGKPENKKTIYVGVELDGRSHT
jgi:hypothetical protein